jgi:hypothetical protein
MTDARFSRAPLRLSQTTNELSELFTQTEAEYRFYIDENQAWNRLVDQVGSSSGITRSPRRNVRWLWPVAAAVGLMFGGFGWAMTHAALTATHSSRSLPKASEPLERPTHVLRLDSGKTTLPDGSIAELTQGARGSYVETSRETSLSFESGSLDIKVAHQREGHPFTVKARNHAFVVLGTRFTVKINGDNLDLTVSEGRVAVRNQTATLAVVEGGGHWSNAITDVSAVDPIPSARAPSKAGSNDRSASPLGVLLEPNNPTRCQEYLRNGEPKKSEKCYLDIAASNGLSAEMALYEVARLQRDVLANPAAALSTLDDYEARFATGTLALEVKTAKVDLLARLGRADEALRASDALLVNLKGQGRVVELRLLRGNLLRDKGNCTAAEHEYQLIETFPGPRGDQAQFARAACLEQLGRNNEAIDAYRRYLERPNARQALRAQQRLRELSP